MILSAMHPDGSVVAIGNAKALMDYARAVREDERARVVLFLQNRDNYDFDDLATDIADGEHLK